ncbi:hypothetical protein CYMTET_26684, partial [Cymbomonas tetramitiformis]
GADNKRQLKEIEDRILEVLSTSEGNILEDATAIDVLSQSKVVSDDIAHKQRVAEKTEIKIDEARLSYKPVATYGSILFFTVADLASIDPMYQFSLDWYITHFCGSMDTAGPSTNQDRRLENLKECFLRQIFVNVCRSLFEKDKLLFAFLLVITIERDEHANVDPQEWRFLLTGMVASMENVMSAPNPAAEWLPERSWTELCRVSSLPKFEGLANDFAENISLWKMFYDLVEPHKGMLHGKWNEELNSLQRTIVLRCLRPDKVVLRIQDFVTEKIGRQFVEPPPFDLTLIFQDSAATAPLVFILSAGTDPTAVLLSFAQQRGQPIRTISLGQGQGPKAERAIKEGRGDGTWVMLQNCHLAASWMPRLEIICEGFTESSCVNQFRLWLTSYPSEHFPVAILQNSVKMTNEPPKGLRTNIMRAYSTEPLSPPAFLDSCTHPGWKNLLFGLCFFHAVLQERLKFGPLGFNVPYQFSEADFVISVRQLKMFLQESIDEDPLADAPFEALLYTTGQCNYGGRVTDDRDRICMMNLLQGIYCEDILREEAMLSRSGTYYVPSEKDAKGYVAEVSKFPINALTEVFGLHENADITKDMQETALMFSSILLTQGRVSSGGGKTREEVVTEMTNSLLARLPADFDLEKVQDRWPVVYEESMNTVLIQECIRFNRLLAVIRTSMENLQRALKGFVLMSTDLDQLATDMYDGKQPALWAKRSYPSLMSLTSYVEDFLERLAMLTKWIRNGPPVVFWISGFFFTHAFLTAALQNFARKYRVPIDDVQMDFEMLKGKDYEEKPTDGVYVQGLFFEGARWDAQTHQIAESAPKILFTKAPVMWFKPCQTARVSSYPHYNCPVYRTAERRGTLSTTGHSTNFVLNIRIPSEKPSAHWTGRGVAMLTQLTDA